MEWYRQLVSHVKLRRFCVLALVILVLYLVRDMMTTVLLTFIFTYLNVRVVRKIQKYIKIPTALLTLVLYCLMILVLYFVLTRFIPVIITQSSHMYQSVVDFYQKRPSHNDLLAQMLHDYLNRIDLVQQIQHNAALVLRYIQDFGSVATSCIMSFILSFFYMIEKRQTEDFSRLFLQGGFAWFFQDLYYFAKKFTNTFGVVIETQFLIALINTGLTTIALGFLGFDQLPSLALMVFILSLIPVAGVIISCVPLSFIAYYQGGLRDVIYVLITIVIVHIIESYVLNPKLMASKTEVPIFYTFVILLLSERFLGIWGLIVGIPIFTFFLDILHIKPLGRHLPQLKRVVVKKKGDISK